MAKFQACPKCNRRGLHYADHPHAQGWKDYEHVACRFCGARFRVKESAPNTASTGQGRAAPEFDNFE
jgi:uncharacterized protein YbaR (Trm112 family)